MIQGTTPEHIFKLPFNTDLISKIRIVYSQGNEVVITKTIEDCVLDESTVTVRLTQEDTLSLTPNKTCYIQMRVLTLAGDALASTPIAVTVEKCLEVKVIE